MSEIKRCGWVDLKSNEYVEYHDKEWGVPVYDDVKLFEMLILEGAQAGLSWLTVLKRRQGYRRAFDNFDFKKVAEYDDKKIAELLEDSRIIRNRLKIKSAVKNAKIFIEIIKECGAFSNYLWSFTGNKQMQNSFKELKDVPAKTKLSDEISKDLKKRGMSFTGSTIIYAFLQAVGVVNDHQTDCFRYNVIKNNSTC
jgi:DNA-3-methyladenine glycosylase I